MIILTETEKNKLRELHKAYSVIQEAMTISVENEKDLRDCVNAALNNDEVAGAHLLGWLPLSCIWCMFNRKGKDFNPELYDRDKNCIIDMQKLLRDKDAEEGGPAYFSKFMDIAEEVIECLEKKGTI